MFSAGAIIGQAILDSSKWIAGEKKINSSNKIISKSVDLIKGAFTAVGTALGASIYKANEWQKSFSNVSTLVDSSTVDLQGMSLELFKLDNRLGSTTDLTDGLYQALSASVEPAKAVGFVAESAKFAKAALTDTNTAVDVITTGLNAYGMEADKATEISDQLFSVIKLGKTTGAELASVIGSSIPLAANMGISFDELGASVAIMTRQGISAAESTTRFNAVINSFLKPSETLGKNIKALGYESGEAMIKQLGFKGALDKVIEASGGSKTEIAAMFKNVRALQGAVALTGEGAKDFSEVLDQITNSTGATQEAFEKQELTMETFKNTTGELSIIVGNIAKAFSDKLAVGATEAANSMINFLLSSQGAKVVSDIIATASAAFETLKLILEPIVKSIFKEANKIWKTATTQLDKLTGGAGDGAGAFKALAFASQFVTAGIKIVSTVIQGGIKSLSELIQAITASTKTVGSFFEFLAGKTSWDEVKNNASAAGKAFEILGKGIFNNTIDVFKVAMDEVKKFEDATDNATANIAVTWKTTSLVQKQNALDTYNELLTGQENFVESFTESSKKLSENLKISHQELNTTIKENNIETTDQLIENNNIVTEQTEKNIERQKTAWEEYYDGLQQKANDNSLFMTNMFKTGTDAIQDVIFKSTAALGEMFVKGKNASKDFFTAFKDAAKEAIAITLEALAKEFAIRAIAAAFLSPAAAAGWGAAAVAAGITAGVVRALAKGGIMNPGIALVGEEGPELINVGTTSRVYSHDESKKIFSGGNIYNTFYVNNIIDAEMAAQKIGRIINRGKQRI